MYEMKSMGPVVLGKGRVTLAGAALRVHVYWVDGALIDTGPAVLGRSFVPFVAALPGPVTRLALTHLHEDHCGMAAYVAAQGVPVYTHPEFTHVMATRPRLPTYRKHFWGVPDPFVAQPFDPVFETERYAFQVVSTPGHADEHVVLHEGNEGWLFAGDLFIAPRVMTITRHESLPLLMTSIRRALQLDFDTLFCAHAGVVPDGKAALRRRLQALEDVQGRVHELAARGWGVQRVRRHLFPGFQPLTWISMGEYSPAHIVRSFWPTRDDR